MNIPNGPLTLALLLFYILFMRMKRYKYIFQWNYYYMKVHCIVTWIFKIKNKVVNTRQIGASRPHPKEAYINKA